MSLEVRVKSASNLPNVERWSKSDPMTVLLFQGEKKKTKVIDNNLDPEWNESFTYTIANPLGGGDVLEVKVYDYERIGRNRLLGEVNIPLSEVARSGSTDTSYTLKGKDGSQSKAKINIAMTYTAPEGAGGGGGGGRGGGNQDDEDEGEITLGDEAADTGEEPAGETLTGEGGGKTSAATEEARHKARRKRAARAQLPEKPTDFQVRVHVIEGRKLVGGNIKPVVKVICGKDVEETSVQKSTNQPFWDEMVYFNFKVLPKEMLEKVVDIKVLNSIILIKDSLIGSFKFDLGMVYDEPEHCFIHKWLLLTDPYDGAGGCKGYLKISINVMGPGDEPKPSPPAVSGENVDIEANLLRPSGMRLQPATLSIKIFKAEDLPQMDPGYFEGIKKFFGGTAQKELVDPYTVVAFAGHKGRTDVIWNDMTPDWNHQVNLGVRFPSMCDQVKIYMKDKDKLGKDDYIGTTYIALSEISASGDNGFAPTFGPTFVNIYGSPREFTDLPDKFEYLNKGQLPGVSYRGRIMIQLDVNIGHLPTERHQTIKPDEVKALDNYLGRRKYKLSVAFDSATMVYPIDSPVEFEVSIGNFGNKLDKFVPATSSTTQPTNPVYDGCKYHYLPWLDTKPCVTIDSDWEDNTYRIESLNILLHMTEQLQTGVKTVRDMMQMDDFDTTEAAAKLLVILEQLIENLEQPMPVLPEKGFTKLDVNMRKFRMAELNAILYEARHLLQAHGLSPDIDATATECEDYLHRLLSLCNEPQNTVPDVIIWMLSAGKRVASCRIPSHKLMYSTTAKARGQDCGKMQTVFLMPPAVEKEEELKSRKERAQVRLQIWLGLAKYQSEWRNDTAGGEVAVYAETYENQACIFGKWGTIGLLRPNFSDARGKRKLKKDYFVAPDGWRWDGEWFINPELSVEFDPDEGLNEFQEDIYEHEIRLPFSAFGHHEAYWADVRGDKLTGRDDKAITRDEMQISDGWKWSTQWEIEQNGAVDEEGWEYCVEAGLGGWQSSERTFHLCRRRRWVRTRIRVSDPKVAEKKAAKRKKRIDEGWEYARLPQFSYHTTEHTLDLSRRRRWHRKLVNVDPSKRPIFYFADEKKKKKKKDEDDDDDDDSGSAPRMFLTYGDQEVHTYQLRAYIYQARELHGRDKSGLSDPYGILSFNRYGARTNILKESICPTWDQTLWIENIKLFGDPATILQSPPYVYIEFFDKDTIGSNELLGFMKAQPTVRLDPRAPQPRLDWYLIYRYNQAAGELLAAFELILESGDQMLLAPPKSPNGKYYIVPTGIRPVLQKTRIEVLCWGVRDMKRYQLQKVDSPLVEIECGGTVVRTQPIKDASKDPNFPDPIISFDVFLPKEDLYAPPLNIRVLDKRAFGRHPMVGTHIIGSLKQYYTDPTPEKIIVEAFGAAQEAATHPDPTQEAEQKKLEEEKLDDDPDNKKESDFDWWSKYYASGNDPSKIQEDYNTQGYDQLKMYTKELEEEEPFNNFTDFAETFPLYRGKGSRDPDESEGQCCGYLKGAVKVYPLPPDGPQPEKILSTDSVPSTKAEECIVRVYVVRANDLQPQDPNGKSDPYLKLKLGGEKISDEDNFIPNTLNPVFGRMFELKANLPIDRTLEVIVMDHDLLSANDLIGATTIDLENRYLTKHMALSGLPKSFHKSGPNKWRQQLLPREILAEVCKRRRYGDPVFHCSTQCTVNNQLYNLDEIEAEKKANNQLPPELGAPDQRLALHILNGMDLVPEHVERRSLYTPSCPKIEQGSLEMWVDIFPKSIGPAPDPVDISPRKAEKYELRLVVWNTVDVTLDEVSFVTGEAMSDIYVKGWLRGMDETQKTDVHYRSMDGEGNFNWRFVFPFEYIPSEQVMVVSKKEHFWSLDKTVKHLQPRINLQVWDNDLFNPDDFLGTMDINLLAMPEGKKTARSCDIDMFPDPGNPDQKKNKKFNLLSLFKKKRMKGFWPFYNEAEGERVLAGKLEMEIEVLTEEEALLRPAAKAREDPNMNPHLDEPNRPATSFLWITSPFKTLRFIIWRHYKWYIIFGIILILFIILLAIWIYSAPSYFMEWMTNTILP